MQHNEFNTWTFLPSVHVLQKAHLSQVTHLQKYTKYKTYNDHDLLSTVFKSKVSK